MRFPIVLSPLQAIRFRVVLSNFPGHGGQAGVVGGAGVQTRPRDLGTQALPSGTTRGGKRDELGSTAKPHAGSCGKPNPRTRRGRRGRVDARDARRASREWTRPAYGRAATRTESVTAIETRPFAPGKFQPENVFGREEGVSSRRESRVE